MSVFDLFEKLKSRSSNVGPIKKIVVGLGNPGPKYDNTRHNVGFKAVDSIANEFNINVDKHKFKSFVGDGVINGVRCLLVKPLTFMNESGIAVEAAREYYKLDVSDIIVLFDDISFDPGKIRIRKRGSAGGHNGIKSIIYSTGEETFSRIKIGVGAKPSREYDLGRWVLSRFDDNDIAKIDEANKCVVEAVKLMVCEKIEEAMNKFN